MRNEPSLRLPVPTEAADFEAMTELNDDERKIGTMMAEMQFLGAIDYSGPADQARLKEREPSFLFLYDPEVASKFMGPDIYGLLIKSVCDMTFEEVFDATTNPKGLVTDNPDKAALWRQAMLMVFGLAHEFNDAWTMRLMATKPHMFTAEESVMIGHPEADVWNDDERFVLQFTRAVLRHALTDEMFARATAAWGTKGMLRRVSFIGMYNFTLMFADVNISDAYRSQQAT